MNYGLLSGWHGAAEIQVVDDEQENRADHRYQCVDHVLASHLHITRKLATKFAMTWENRKNVNTTTTENHKTIELSRFGLH